MRGVHLVLIVEGERDDIAKMMGRAADWIGRTLDGVTLRGVDLKTARAAVCEVRDDEDDS